MRIKTRQKIDRLIGPFICFFLTVWKNFTSLFFNSYHIKKISHQDEFTVLIIKFWGMGSILLASDGVSSIKKISLNQR